MSPSEALDRLAARIAGVDHPVVYAPDETLCPCSYCDGFRRRVRRKALGLLAHALAGIVLGLALRVGFEDVPPGIGIPSVLALSYGFGIVWEVFGQEAVRLLRLRLLPSARPWDPTPSLRGALAFPVGTAIGLVVAFSLGV